MSKADYPFCFPFRVRYSEADAQGIVFNAHYLTYFDTAVYEYFRALPFDYVAHAAQTDFDFHTVHVDIDFIAPARFDDEIEVCVKTDKIGRSSLRFALAVYPKDSDTVMVKGNVVWVHVDQTTRKSCAIPGKLVERIKRLQP